MVVADFFQIEGNLHLHVVGDVFIFLYALILSVEVFLVLFVEQDCHHAEHSLHAFGKVVDFFLCL